MWWNALLSIIHIVVFASHCLPRSTNDCVLADTKSVSAALERENELCEETKCHQAVPTQGILSI